MARSPSTNQGINEQRNEALIPGQDVKNAFVEPLFKKTGVHVLHVVTLKSHNDKWFWYVLVPKGQF